MFVIARALTYATALFALVVLYAGGHAASTPAVQRIFGVLVAAGGAAIMLWCAATFAVLGKGTPAPFDPPRRLVTRGPYRFVRNPIYIGAGVALTGAALAYGSLSLLGYTAVFFVAAHGFVVWFEEPMLRRTFGPEYEVYCERVRRWWPRVAS